MSFVFLSFVSSFVPPFQVSLPLPLDSSTRPPRSPRPPSHAPPATSHHFFFHFSLCDDEAKGCVISYPPRFHCSTCECNLILIICVEREQKDNIRWVVYSVGRAAVLNKQVTHLVHSTRRFITTHRHVAASTLNTTSIK